MKTYRIATKTAAHFAYSRKIFFPVIATFVLYVFSCHAGDSMEMPMGKLACVHYEIKSLGFYVSRAT